MKNREQKLTTIVLVSTLVSFLHSPSLFTGTNCPSLPDSSGICSDDFSSLELDPNIWKFYDPMGGASYQVTGSHLKIFIPEGSDHDIWKTGNKSARLMQQANDADFQVEAQFDMQLSRSYTMYGILVEEDEQNFLRFEFNCIPTTLRIFAASFVDGAPTTCIFKDIDTNGVIYMRITRAGDEWTQSYSYDRQEWISCRTFSHPLKVTAIGPFAANAGVYPTLTLSVDYFFNNAAPIHPEDNVASIPEAPTDFSAKAVSMSQIQLQWTDNSDLEDGYVIECSQDGGDFLKIGSVGANATKYSDTIEHPRGEYGYRVAALNDEGTSERSDPVQTSLPTTPVISFFYGDTQHFGHLGLSQRYINILGNVSDADTVDHVLYSLNNAPEESLRIGSDCMRLGYPGDFNIELEPKNLKLGQNTIAVRAVTKVNTYTIKAVDLFVHANPPPSPSYTIKWDTVQSIQNVAQVIDGKWEICNGALRSVEVGFDRLVGIGDTSWTDYEITIPITMHNFYYRSAEGGGPGVGILARWKGHTGDDVPRLGHPYGMLAWYKKSYDDAIGYRMCMYKNGDYLVAEDSTGRTLELNTPYMFKLKVETTEDKKTEYNFKVWLQQEMEPPDLYLTSTVTGPDYGSVVLVSHKSDISFGDIQIVNIKTTVVADNRDDFVEQTPTLFFPNPFNGTTSMNIRLSEPQMVRLRIYNVLGELLLVPVNKEMVNGDHILTWDGRDMYNQTAASGIYFYTLDVGDKTFKGRMMVMR